MREFTIEPMKLIVTDPKAVYRCPECGIWIAFFDQDPEWFVCGMRRRSVTPYADG